MSKAASSNSRLAPARRRARILKITSAGAAVIGFGALSVIVRGGTHSNSTTATPAAAASGTLSLSSRISQEAGQAGAALFNSGSVTPAQSSSQPRASTHTS